MKKILQIVVLIALALIFTDAKAQDVTAKEITAQAAKAALDKDNVAMASGAGIKGKFTAVKMPAGVNEDLKQGFYAGLLELDVKGEFGSLRSGKFNLFFKEGKQGLRLYLEEKGELAAILEATQTTPENYSETKTGDRPALDFPEFSNPDKLTQNFAAFDQPGMFSFAAGALLSRCKVYIRIVVNGHRYWIWSGATRDCRTKPSR